MRQKALKTNALSNSATIASAPYEINISGLTREKCTQRYHERDFGVDVFDQALAEVMGGFYTDGFLRFLSKKEQKKLPDLRHSKVVSSMA